MKLLLLLGARRHGRVTTRPGRGSFSKQVAALSVQPSAVAQHGPPADKGNLSTAELPDGAGCDKRLTVQARRTEEIDVAYHVGCSGNCPPRGWHATCPSAPGMSDSIPSHTAQQLLPQQKKKWGTSSTLHIHFIVHKANPEYR